MTHSDTAATTLDGVSTETELDLDRLVPARASIKFGGLNVGDLVLVDPRDPEIIAYVEGSILVLAQTANPEPPANGSGETEGRTG